MKLVAAQTSILLSSHPFPSYVVLAKPWHLSDSALGQFNSLNQQESKFSKTK